MATPAGTVAPPAPAVRLVSLDVFRGLAMAAMVIVNNPGDWGNVYGPLLHAEWHGWTPTDLIFPFFLFIVGTSITLSRRTAGWGAIARRSVTIFALGLFLAGYPRFDLSRWRISGVLQRIAVCYLVSALAFRWTAGTRRKQGVVLAVLAAGLALAYWALIALAPPPGGIAGDLSPEGNLGAWLDRTIMAGHLWRPGWDPEGVLSTIPAIATTLLGVVAGLWIGSAASPVRKAAVLATARLAGVGAGLAWDLVFPINKNLWTSSYVTFTAGAAALLLAACYWTIEVKGYRAWTKPFVILGTNAIVLFVASGLLVKALLAIRIPAADGATMAASQYLYSLWFTPLAPPRLASLLYAVANLILLFGLLAWMHRRRIFLRA